MTLPDAYRAAAAKVREGWCQHILQNDRGDVCALGGLSQALHGTPFRVHKLEDVLPLAKAIRPDVEREITDPLFPASPSLHVIVDWNNRPQRTAEEVATLFEATALFLEEEAKLAAEKVEVLA